MILGKLTALDRRQQADCPDGMLVDRIMMVHVELHLRDDAAEIGNETAEHAGLIHPAQRGLGIVSTGQHLEEQRVRFRVAADVVDEFRVARGGAHRQRMDFEAVTVGQHEHLDQPAGFLGEEILVRQSQPTPVEHEAVELARSAAQHRQAEAASARCEFIVEMRQEDPGQVADRFRLEEIVMHDSQARRYDGF